MAAVTNSVMRVRRFVVRPAGPTGMSAEACIGGLPEAVNGGKGGEQRRRDDRQDAEKDLAAARPNCCREEGERDAGETCEPAAESEAQPDPPLAVAASVACRQSLQGVFDESLGR